MPDIGFSTGALFKGDLVAGVNAATTLGLPVIELSALRLSELTPLVEFVGSRKLSQFRYVSVHSPTNFAEEQEETVSQALLKIAHDRGWPIVVHPDNIRDLDAWAPFGDHLCVENMDKRKPAGRTVGELREVFERLPMARLCFDMAHAYQVDTSMTEAYQILREFGSRICQVHLSQLATNSRHERLSDTTVGAFREIARFIPANIPVILETPVALADAPREIRQATKIFEVVPIPAH